MRRLAASLAIVLLAGAVGFAVTKLAAPNQASSLTATEETITDEILASALRCLDNPIQRFPILQYGVDSLVPLPRGNSQFEANIAISDERPGASLTPGKSRLSRDRGSYRAEVTAYTIFAIPLYTILVETPGECSVVR